MSLMGRAGSRGPADSAGLIKYAATAPHQALEKAQLSSSNKFRDNSGKVLFLKSNWLVVGTIDLFLHPAQ